MSKNYEEMSDGAINLEVHYLANDIPKHHAVIMTKNYCNNPSDAWPIMLENKIATEWHYADVWRAQCYNQHKPGSYKVFTSYCYNPLRAAMICFLKMKDSESDHA